MNEQTNWLIDWLIDGISDGCELFNAEAVIAILKESSDYDDVMFNRLQTVLTAPHKHKGREARKTKEHGMS